MPGVIALVLGSTVSILIFLNGKVSASSGDYIALLALNGFALAISSVFTARRKVGISRRRPWYAGGTASGEKQTGSLATSSRVPLWMLSGGCIGVVVIYAENIAMRGLGVSLTVALLFAGQLAASAFVDAFGLFGRQRLPFGKGRLFAMSLVAFGVFLL